MKNSNWDTSLSTATYLDENDPLGAYRDRFHIPGADGQSWVYMCGNSLGLQALSVKGAVMDELDRWSRLGVEGWFEGDRPWLSRHIALSDKMAPILGAQSSEVVIMNSLTVNLHLLMASFYKPVRKKTKILIEKDAFPSDHHMVASQIKWHGLDPEEHIIHVRPDADSDLIDEGEICATIEANRDELALVLLGGVNYYTGQVLDMERLAACCQANQICFGLDLAHAVGNVPLDLHQWGVDFAAWCTYKYLNSGPGGPGAIFVHDQHTKEKNQDRLTGWWGHDEATRFQMKDEHIPMIGAAGWQISTPQIMNFVALGESLAIFDEIGIDQIDAKRRLMNTYFDMLIKDLQSKGKDLSIVNPSNLDQRGAQFSFRFKENARAIFDELIRRGVIGDWRSPDVIRLSPAPLYNLFSEIHYVYSILLEIG